MPPVTKAVTSTLSGISFALFEQIDTSNHNKHKHKHKQNHPISLGYCSAIEWLGKQCNFEIVFV